jgi:hypothetical protein
MPSATTRRPSCFDRFITPATILGRVSVADHPSYEGTVDLQRVDRELTKIGQRRVPRSESSTLMRTAHGPELHQQRGHRSRIGDGDPLGQFQHQASRLEAELCSACSI